jgi:hypothetical protein
MSNGQQLEMVDGSLVEIVPATIQLPDGEIIGHKILDWESSRAAAAAARAGHKHSAVCVAPFFLFCGIDFLRLLVHNLCPPLHVKLFLLISCGLSVSVAKISTFFEVTCRT